MDGSRFDLMGLLDVRSINKIQEELDRRWGRGEKLVFGEPWSAGGTSARPGTLLAGKEGLPALDPAIGAFCDTTRDAVKDPIADEKVSVPGFVNGGGLDGKKLLHCLRGWSGEEGPFAAPAQTITYLSCHDDWTLWDKLVDYYQGLIALWTLLPGLCDKSMDAPVGWGCWKSPLKTV